MATDIFKIPKIFGEMIFSRIEERQGPGGLPKIGNKPKVNKQILLRFWEANDFHRKEPK